MKLSQVRKRKFIICLCMLFTAVFLSCEKADNNADKDGAETKDLSKQTNPVEITVTPPVVEENRDTQTTDTSESETKAYMEKYQETGVLPSLAAIYKDRFRIGVALSNIDINNKDKAQLVASQFNSITCENEMKPDFILDRAASINAGDEECPAINMRNAETALSFAKEYGLTMRAHTLVWHSQTPRWFFTVGYDNSSDAPFVTREVMLARMENYIRLVMEYVDTNYPGVIYAWDVVNEAIEPGDGREDGIRVKNNNWFEVVGPDYVEMAFTYARKYAAPDQKLFYNDYGTYDKSKMYYIRNMIIPLQEKNLIDGIGMQDHMQLTNPSILDYQYTINKYAEMGLEIQITELDMNTTDNSEEGQNRLGSRYKAIMTIIQNCMEKNNANITSITFWGLTDDRSWLNKADQPCYPLLFDKNLKPKPAYFGVAMDTSISIRY
jgi:endo-1,4-beta-xylanase